MTRDLVLGCVLLAISAAYYFGAAAIPDSDLADAVGPAGLPAVYAILLAALGLLLMARAVKARRAVAAATPSRPTDAGSRSIGRVAVMLAFGILYIVVVPTAGYLISIAALLVATALYHARFAPAVGVRSGRRPGTTPILIVGIAGAGLLWLVFVVLLRIPQPGGIWSALWGGS
jgi:hypothetical protein